MNEVFVDIVIKVSIILSILGIISMVCYTIYKHGITFFTQKITDSLDYIIDKLEDDVQKLIKFLISQLEHIFIIILSQSINLSILGMLHVIRTSVLVEHASWSIVIILCATMVLLSFISLGFGKSLINILSNSVNKYIDHKNPDINFNKDEKQD